MSYKNIVVVGGSGRLGPAVVKELLSASLNVTVTTRKESTSTFPDNVKVARTDYTLESLVEIFEGQDAVISNLGGPQISKQKVLIDAAIEAGVKRFIPSEFGSDTRDLEQLKELPLFQEKHHITAYLKTKQDSLEWTAIICGCWFDLAFGLGFIGFDLKTQKADILDGGDHKISMTNMYIVGKALAAIFTKPELVEATKNQYVALASHTATENEMLAILEELSQSKWRINPKTSEDVVHKAKKEFEQTGNPMALYEIVKVHAFGKHVPTDHTEFPGGVWNDRLGLPKEDLKEDLKKWLDVAQKA